MADINDIKTNIAGSIRSFNKWRDDRQIKREEKSIKESEKRVAAHQAEMEKVRKGGLWQKSKDLAAWGLGIRTKLERMESGSRGKQLDLDYMKLGTSKEEMFSNVSRSQLKIDLPDFKKVGLTKNSDSDLSKINVRPMNEYRLNQSFVSTIKDEFAKINNNTKIIKSHLQVRDRDIEKIENKIDRTVKSISTHISELTKRVNTVESELQNLRANNKTTQPSDLTGVMGAGKPNIPGGPNIDLTNFIKAGAGAGLGRAAMRGAAGLGRAAMRGAAGLSRLMLRNPVGLAATGLLTAAYLKGRAARERPEEFAEFQRRFGGNARADVIQGPEQELNEYGPTAPRAKTPDQLLAERGYSRKDVKSISGDRKSTRLNSSHMSESRMPSSA